MKLPIVIILGAVIIASSIYFNDNGRYVYYKAQDKRSDSILDTKTGIIYGQIKSTHFGIREYSIDLLKKKSKD